MRFFASTDNQTEDYEVVKRKSSNTYLTAASVPAATAAMPIPALALSSVSTSSRFLRKYWPTMRVPLSRSRPTPRAAKEQN